MLLTLLYVVVFFLMIALIITIKFILQLAKCIKRNTETIGALYSVIKTQTECLRLLKEGRE